MQASPNNVYQLPETDKSSAPNQPVERGNFDVRETSRQNRIHEAQVDLEKYFASAALTEKNSAAARAAAEREAAPDQDSTAMLEYVSGVGRFLESERDEVINHGWAA